MNSRERIRAVLNHEVPDRVPNGLGGCETTSLHVLAYDNLQRMLGVERKPPKVDSCMCIAVFEEPVIEFSYKNDALGDPLLNTDHALALKVATRAEIDTIKSYALKVNSSLKAFWAECGVTLVDFKLEFGKTTDGSIILADEISPDTCRLWDSATGEKLDKDRFRRDLGGVEEAYAEIMKRLVDHEEK